MRSLCTSACQAKVSIVLVKSHPLAVARASRLVPHFGATSAGPRPLGEQALLHRSPRHRPSAPIAGAIVRPCPTLLTSSLTGTAAPGSAWARAH